MGMGMDTSMGVGGRTPWARPPAATAVRCMQLPTSFALPPGAAPALLSLHGCLPGCRRAWNAAHEALFPGTRPGEGLGGAPYLNFTQPPWPKVREGGGTKEHPSAAPSVHPRVVPRHAACCAAQPHAHSWLSFDQII